MKIISITGKGNSKMVWVEPGPANFPIEPGFDMARFVGKTVKSMFMRSGKVVGVEHTNGQVTGERS